MLPSCTNEMLFRKNEMLPSSTAHIHQHFEGDFKAIF